MKILIDIQEIERIIEKKESGQSLSIDEWRFIHSVRRLFGAKNFKKACKLLKKAGL